MSKSECSPDKPHWFSNKILNEVAFCEAFLASHPMVCVNGSFFNRDGRITDEESLSNVSRIFLNKRYESDAFLWWSMKIQLPTFYNKHIRRTSHESEN